MMNLKELESKAIVTIEKEKVLIMIIANLELLGFKENNNKIDNSNELEFVTTYNISDIAIFINTDYKNNDIVLDCYYKDSHASCKISLVYSDMNKMNVEAYIEMLLETIFAKNYKLKSS